MRPGFSEGNFRSEADLGLPNATGRTTLGVGTTGGESTDEDGRFFFSMNQAKQNNIEWLYRRLEGGSQTFYKKRFVI